MGWETVKTPSGQLYDLPIIGDDLANIGRIIDLYGSPCSPYVEVWVYALWQAFPTLFITLTKPELIDIDIHKGHHRPRRGKRARFRASAIFRDSIISVPVPSWRVFRIYEFYQRIGYYFLVADALEDFSINWMSMAYKMQGCPVEGSPYFRGSFEDTLVAAGVNPGPARMDWINGINHGFSGIYPARRPNEPGNYRSTWQVSWGPVVPENLTSIPDSTVLFVDGVANAIGEGSIIDSLHGYSSGDTYGVADAPSLPSFQLMANFGEGMKFARATGSWSIDRVTGDEIGPDP